MEGGIVATIRERHGTVDLVWNIIGPQEISRARKTIMGLPDLLMQYDLASAKAKRRASKGE